MNPLFPIRYAWIKFFWFITRPIRRAYGFIFRPHRRSAKVLIKDGERILLVRPNYGHRLWTLPGGKVGKSETFEAGALREVKEETGLDLMSLQYLGEYETDFQFQKNTIKIFLATPKNTNFKIDGIEIKDGGWFPIDNLPPDRVPRLDQFLKMYESSQGIS